MLLLAVVPVQHGGGGRGRAGYGEVLGLPVLCRRLRSARVQELQLAVLLRWLRLRLRLLGLRLRLGLAADEVYRQDDEAEPWVPPLDDLAQLARVLIVLQQEHHANPSRLRRLHALGDSPSEIVDAPAVSLPQAGKVVFAPLVKLLRAADRLAFVVERHPGQVAMDGGAARPHVPRVLRASQLLLQAGEGVAAADRQALICADLLRLCQGHPGDDLQLRRAALAARFAGHGLDRSTGRRKQEAQGTGCRGCASRAGRGCGPGLSEEGAAGEGRGSDRQGARLHESLEIAPQELADGAMRSVGDVEGPGLVALRLPPQVAQTRRQHAAEAVGAQRQHVSGPQRRRSRSSLGGGGRHRPPEALLDHLTGYGRRHRRCEPIPNPSTPTPTRSDKIRRGGGHRRKLRSLASLVPILN